MSNNNFAEQRKTLEDTLAKLQETGMCAILRPTGFGKTYILTELISHYNKVLYLYPSTVIADTVIDKYITDMYEDEDVVVDPETIDNIIRFKQIPNCTLMTYSALIRLDDDELRNMDYDLILFDEMHRLGGARTKDATHKLFAYNPNAHFVGATATPTRMDNFDPVAVFFNNIMCYPYTLHDAIEDGLLQKPHYYYCTTDIRKDLENMAKDLGEDIADKMVADIIDSKVIEAAHLFDMGTIIRDACDTYAIKPATPDSNEPYFKFIVFFATKNHMDEKLPEVETWFKEAYPNHNINTLKIRSGSSEAKNTDKLSTMIPKQGTIDIIACIDMLNVGYHVNDLTGILMYRGTKSSTIFIQQLGRALSAGTNNAAIIIDVVDNLHRRAVFELQSSLVQKPIRKKNSASTNKKTVNFFVSDDDGSTIMAYDADGKPFETKYHLDENNNIVDNHNNQSVFEYNCDNGKIYENIDMTNKNINNYCREDFHMTGHEATYREFCAKALAEPLTQRCKYAIELCFRTWCLNHGVPYPISDKELKELYALDKNDFYKEFSARIANNAIGFPLQDAEALLQIGKDKGSIDVPLDICAKARNVSTELILDVLNIA